VVSAPGGEEVLRIDGTVPVSVTTVAAVQAFCDKAEDHELPDAAVVEVSGAPDGTPPDDLSVGLVSKWENALRRLERLPAPTVAVAAGDCGGAALEALLTTDFRIATPDVRLLVDVDGDATWPGMALFRLTRQAGAARIRRAVLLGEPIGAAEALAIGLVHQLTDDPRAALADLEERTAALSGKELAIRRQLMFNAGSASFEDALGSHLAACDRTLRRKAAR
jgi:isomerase DpgB